MLKITYLLSNQKRIIARVHFQKIKVKNLKMILSGQKNQKTNGKIKSYGQKNYIFLQVNWIPARYLMGNKLMG